MIAMGFNVHALLVPILLAGFFGPGLQQIPAVCMVVYLPLTLLYTRTTLVKAEATREFVGAVSERRTFCSDLMCYLQ